MFINICKSVWFSLKFADFLFKPIVPNLDISNAGLGTRNPDNIDCQDYLFYRAYKSFNSLIKQ